MSFESVAEVEALDDKLRDRAKVLRNVLKMFYRANRRSDLLDALPRQRQGKVRRIGLDTVLMPDDVMAIIAKCDNLRDRAIIATLAATGGRINEVLGIHLRDLRESNGDCRVFFGRKKIAGQERYSPKINGAWKRHLDAWIAKHARSNDRDAILFPSSLTGGKLGDSAVGKTISDLAKRAGIRKPVNPHAFRHARVTWGIIRGEDVTKLSVAIWGRPVSEMLNRYAHFSGLDTTLGEPREIALPEVPPLPVPPVMATQREVAELKARLAEAEGRMAKPRALSPGEMEKIALATFDLITTSSPEEIEKVAALGRKRRGRK